MMDERDIACLLIKEFWKEHNDYEQSSEESNSNLKEWTKEGHKFYLIKLENQFVGFVHLGNRGVEIDWLEDIFVLPKYQGNGIGRKAISLVENIVRQYSDSLYIEAAAQNINAIRLYHRIGYDRLNTITVRKDFYPDKYEIISNESIHDLDFCIKKFNE